MDFSFEEWVNLPETRRLHPCIDRFGDEILALGATWETFQLRPTNSVVRDLESVVPHVAARDVVEVAKSEIYRCSGVPLSMYWDIDSFPVVKRVRMLREYWSLRSQLEQYGRHVQTLLYTSDLPDQIKVQLTQEVQGLRIVECCTQDRTAVSASNMIGIDATRFACHYPDGATLCFVVSREKIQEYKYLLEVLNSRSSIDCSSRTILVSSSSSSDELSSLSLIADVYLNWDTSKSKSSTSILSSPICRVFKKAEGHVECQPDTPCFGPTSNATSSTSSGKSPSRSHSDDVQSVESRENQSNQDVDDDFDDGSSHYSGDNSDSHVLDILSDARSALGIVDADGSDKSKHESEHTEGGIHTTHNEARSIGSASQIVTTKVDPSWFVETDSFGVESHPINDSDIELFVKAMEDDDTRLFDGCAHTDILKDKLKKANTKRFQTNDDVDSFLSGLVEWGIAQELVHYGIMIWLGQKETSIRVCRRLPISFQEYSDLSNDARNELASSPFVVTMKTHHFRTDEAVLHTHLVAMSARGLENCFLNFESLEDVVRILKMAKSLVSGTLIPGELFRYSTPLTILRNRSVLSGEENMKVDPAWLFGEKEIATYSEHTGDHDMLHLANIINQDKFGLMKGLALRKHVIAILEKETPDPESFLRKAIEKGVINNPQEFGQQIFLKHKPLIFDASSKMWVAKRLVTNLSVWRRMFSSTYAIVIGIWFSKKQIEKVEFEVGENFCYLFFDSISEVARQVKAKKSLLMGNLIRCSDYCPSGEKILLDSCPASVRMIAQDPDSLDAWACLIKESTKNNKGGKSIQGIKLERKVRRFLETHMFETKILAQIFVESAVSSGALN